MPVTVNIGSNAPLVGGASATPIEPGALLVTGEDNLRINIWTSLAIPNIVVRLRFLDLTIGEIIDTEYVVPAGNGRMLTTVDRPLSIGFPISAVAFVQGGASLFGQTFVQVQLIRGLGGGTAVLATLMQGSVGNIVTLGYPGTPLQSPFDGQGITKTVAAGVPAAGADLLETVPGGAIWEIVSLTGKLTTSAAVANRGVALVFDDGANIYMQSSPNVLQTATQANTYEWMEGGSAFGAAPQVIYQAGVPVNNRVQGNHRIRTVTTALQAADQWSVPFYVIREWLLCNA